MDTLSAIFLMDDNIDMHIILNAAEDLARPLSLLEVQERAKRARNVNYFEAVIPTYTDDQFMEHFRMSRVSCEELVGVIGHQLGNPNKMAPLRKKVLYTIWVLSKQESFLATSDRFDLPVSTGHNIFKEIIMALAALMPRYITWPHRNMYNAAAVVFHRRSRGFPGIIGVIDGCHIPCIQPARNETDYYNRKGFHSIILQGTCDHRGKFIDVFIGMPGRMHDARVFRNSPVFEKMTADVNPLIPAEYHLLGDSAYPLMKNIMTPFKDNGHLTGPQIRYNIKLSTVRSIIERAFGLLKGKFRRLKYLHIADFELGNSMIAAACVLHNFLIDRNEMDNGDYENVDIQSEQESNVQHFEDRNGHPEAEAVQKRNNILQLFS